MASNSVTCILAIAFTESQSPLLKNGTLVFYCYVKITTNFAAQSNTYPRSLNIYYLSFCSSGVWVQISWVLCSGAHWAAIQVSPGAVV